MKLFLDLFGGILRSIGIILIQYKRSFINFNCIFSEFFLFSTDILVDDFQDFVDVYGFNVFCVALLFLVNAAENFSLNGWGKGLN